MTAAKRSTALSTVITVMAMLGMTGCQDETPTDPTVTGVALAKGGGGGGKGPKVESTTPTQAPQGTTLDVHVFGSSFDDGSSVTFTVDGTPTDSVQTNSTSFVSDTELIANITIDLNALDDLYDVEVLSSRGRKGIGADLFTVGTGSENPEGPDVLVTYSDGIMTDAPQLATLSTDGATLGVFNCCPSTFFATLDLKPTVTTAPTCRIENNEAGLAEYLTTVLGPLENNTGGVNFDFGVDRKKATSRKHGLHVVWWATEGPDLGKPIQVFLSNDREFGAFTVDEEDGTAFGLDADQTRFTFRGDGKGAVIVTRGPTGASKDRLICPYDGPDVVILLDRSP